MPAEYTTIKSCSERNTRRNHIWFNQRYSKILRSRNPYLKAENKNVKTTALVTPVICLPLSNTQHTEIPVECKVLAFADPLNTEGQRTIDILIGNDQYAQIIVAHTKKSQDGRRIATQTKHIMSNGWCTTHTRRGPQRNSH